MKKILTRAGISAFCILLAVSFIGCKGKPAPDGNKASGTHEREVELTDQLLCADGKTDYTILLPAEPGLREVTAANELKLFFSQATGVDISIVNETPGGAASGGKYLSIGSTELFKATGEALSFGVLGDSGLRLFTKDDDVFMAGCTQKGTLNAVYEYLFVQFEYECYGTEEYYLKRADSFPFLKMNITEVPDIQYNVSGIGISGLDPVMRNRFRLWDNSEVFVNTGTYYFHNIFDLIPRTEFEAHPKWFSATRGSQTAQVCYLAQGDEAEFEAMTTLAANRMAEFFTANPAIRMIVVNDLDGMPPWCSCDACNANQLKYKTHAADPIIFCNRVAEKLVQWQRDTGDTRDFRVVPMAYGYSAEPPVVEDTKTGGYAAIDQKVICHDNVSVFVTTGAMNQDLEDTNDRESMDFFERIKRWRVLSNEMLLWGYSAEYSNYMLPTNVFNNMGTWYKAMVETDSIYLFDLAQHNVSNAPHFSALQAYLNYKLTWNINYDMSALIDNFFTHYFKDAKAPMLRFFNEHCAYFKTLAQSAYRGETNKVQKKYFPQRTLEQWLAYIDGAYEAIAPLQNTDAKAYQILRDNIDLESIGIRYLLIELYSSSFSAYEAAMMKQAFKADASALKLSRFDEHSGIDSLYSKWGM
jgi:hypothetical protein